MLEEFIRQADEELAEERFECAIKSLNKISLLANASSKYQAMKV